MKKKYVFLSLFLIIVLAIIWATTHVINDGAYEKLNHVNVMKEHFENGEAMYLGYVFSWKGIGRPTLQQVELLKKDGTLLTEDDGFLIETYIEETDGNSIGAVDENWAYTDGMVDRLTPMKNYQIDGGKFRLVLRVKYEGDRTKDDVSEMKITYKKFGITQSQTLPFEGILTGE